MHDNLMRMLFTFVLTGYLTLWAKRGPEKATYWYAPAELDALEARALELDAQGWDTYFSTCPARERGRDGKGMPRIHQKDVCAIPAFFMDLDVGKAGCPATREELHAALMALGAPPSAIVGSGSGCHAYWLLAEPLAIGNGVDLEEAKRLLKGFARGVAAQMGYTGFDLSASEPARVLRIPGTHNHKSGTPASVDVIHLDDQRLYKVEALAPCIAATDLTASKALSDQQLLSKATKAKGGERFTRLWSGQWQGEYPSQSEGDIALCNMLAFWTGGDPSRMDALFRQSGLYRAEKWDELHGAMTYGQMTIGKALVATTQTYAPERPATQDPASPFYLYERAYERIGGYSAKGGSLWAESLDKSGTVTFKPLANFACLITDEVTRDDGAEARKEFTLQGITESGKPLPPVNVPARAFSGMGWVVDAWGADANLSPGTTVKDKARHGIQSASAPMMERSTVFAHTGWRMIGGRPVFLYHGGAVGMEGVSVELGGLLALYGLPTETGNIKEAAAASVGILGVIPRRISIPLLAHVYLAPLCQALEEAGVPPAHVLYLAGRSGSGKTTAAAIGLSHFGPGFNGKRVPASFSDTANSVRDKAFLTKDAPLLVDDFAPVLDPAEQRRRAGIAQQLVRAWGDHADRGRMYADGTLRAAKPPRGLGVMTGEDLPAIGESGLARLFVLDVRKGEIPMGPALTALQDKARDGLMARAMRGYLEWLIPQYDALPALVGGLFREYRPWAQGQMAGVHGRQPEAIAALLVGLQMALRYWREAGAIPDIEPLWAEAERTLLAHSAEQALSIRAEDPVDMFLEALSELWATGEVSARSISETLFPHEASVAFLDDTYIYLLPTVAYRAASEHFHRSGSVFPISRPQLWKRMAERGLIETGAGGPARPKHIPGIGSQKVIWLRRGASGGLFCKQQAHGGFEI